MADIEVEDLEPGRIAEDAPGGPPGPRRSWRFVAILVGLLTLLFGVPLWTLVLAPSWPGGVVLLGSLVVLAGLVALPAGMFGGHREGGSDRLAVVGDTTLGIIWVVFTWSVLGNVLGLVLLAAGVDDPARSRIVAVLALGVAVVLLLWGNYEAMRTSRVRHVEVVLPRLGAGLDGTRVVLLADTHYGPINRVRWSQNVTTVVNSLGADVVVHAGDIADGTPDNRREQAAPLGAVDARLAKVYVTGNHEYYSGAAPWLDRMAELGWDCLHNKHVVVERGGDRLVVAGVDDVTAAASGLAGHRTDLAAALAGTDPELPVLLVAHQPKFIAKAAAAGVDLQLSGHTHGGQIWPFNFLVRLDQPAVGGLSRHGERTQLYTSRGTGFWGPPFRVFAPSEITVLTLRAA